MTYIPLFGIWIGLQFLFMFVFHCHVFQQAIRGFFWNGCGVQAYEALFVSAGSSYSMSSSKSGCSH